MLSGKSTLSILAGIHSEAHKGSYCWQFALFSLLLIAFFGPDSLTAGCTPYREAVKLQCPIYPWKENR